MEYKITSNGFPTVTISKLKKKEIIYAERNSMIASSPIFCQDDKNAGKPTGNLLRRRLMVTEMSGADYSRQIMPTELGQMWADFKLGCRVTADRKRIGEQSYVLYEALEDNQKVTFRSCFLGTIMAWRVDPLLPGEDYVRNGTFVRSVHEEDEIKRPHGTLLTVKGSFLCAKMSVKAKAFHTGDQSIIKNSGTQDAFQKYTGTGYVFLEVHGDLIEIPLYKGEAVDIWPGYLLGFTDGVVPKMKPAGDKTLRNEENNDYVIRLTAGEKGGYVYAHSVDPLEFFRRHKTEE